MEDSVYPEITPFNKGGLQVDETHEIYFEECGNPRGYPVFFFHGGPGSRVREYHRRYFDPDFYRVVLFDQRGCGKSSPRGDTFQNTTRKLISDVDSLRDHLSIEQFLVFGGSWGSTLGVSYALEHPNRVSGLLLRGVFLARKTEIDWYLNGIRNFLPDTIDSIRRGTVEDTIKYYYDGVFGQDNEKAMLLAKTWSAYEASLMKIGSNQQPSSKIEKIDIDDFLSAKIQLHYMLNDCFVDGIKMLDGVAKLKMKTIIVQGRLDMVCPPVTAYELADSLPNAELRIVENGGHSGSQPEIARELRKATDDFKAVFQS